MEKSGNNFFFQQNGKESKEDTVVKRRIRASVPQNRLSDYLEWLIPHIQEELPAEELNGKTLVTNAVARKIIGKDPADKVDFVTDIEFATPENFDSFIKSVLPKIREHINKNFNDVHYSFGLYSSKASFDEKEQFKKLLSDNEQCEIIANFGMTELRKKDSVSPSNQHSKVRYTA
jgi:hypothetical protein